MAPEVNISLVAYKQVSHGIWCVFQILRMEKASYPCDVFSYGMVLWELLERKEPFEGDNEVDAASKIKRGEVNPKHNFEW